MGLSQTRWECSLDQNLSHPRLLRSRHVWEGTRSYLLAGAPHHPVGLLFLCQRSDEGTEARGGNRLQPRPGSPSWKRERATTQACFLSLHESRAVLTIQDLKTSSWWPAPPPTPSPTGWPLRQDRAASDDDRSLPPSAAVLTKPSRHSRCRCFHRNPQLDLAFQLWENFSRELSATSASLIYGTGSKRRSKGAEGKGKGLLCMLIYFSGSCLQRINVILPDRPLLLYKQQLLLLLFFFLMFNKDATEAARPTRSDIP